MSTTETHTARDRLFEDFKTIVTDAEELLKATAGQSGEKIREMVRPISHLHVTFTIPKILRAWFRRNRKLLKPMVQSANWAIRNCFIPPDPVPFLHQCLFQRLNCQVFHT